MADVAVALDAHRTAVNELIATAEGAGPSWTATPTPSVWSPSQIVEHVALTLEESAKMVAGQPSKFPTLPAFLRPLMRGLFFNRILKKNGFPKLKTMKALNPAAGPPTAEDARPRVEGALGLFEHECRARAESGQPITHTVFGQVPLEDYVRFQELHARHHNQQLAGAVRRRVSVTAEWGKARGV